MAGKKGYLRKAAIFWLAGSVIFAILLTIACGARDTPEEEAVRQVSSDATSAAKAEKEKRSGGAIAAAKANEEELNKLRGEAFRFGLYLMVWEIDKYKAIRGRLLANEALASAMRTARENGVEIMLDNEFSVGSQAVVYIDVYAPDEKIIAFLLGEDAKN